MGNIVQIFPTPKHSYPIDFHFDDTVRDFKSKEAPMLTDVLTAYAAVRALSVASMMTAAVGSADYTYPVTAERDAEATESTHRKRVVCVWSDTGRRHVVTVPPTCRPR